MRTFVLAGLMALLAVGCQQNKKQDQVWDLRGQQGSGVNVQASSAQKENAPNMNNTYANAPREQSTAAKQPKGSPCKVRFRRDALGLMNANGLPMMSDGSPNWPVAMSGNVIGMDANWIELEVNGRRYSIPTSAILMIEWE